MVLPHPLTVFIPDTEVVLTDMGKKQKQLSTEEQRERAEARRLAIGQVDGGGGGGSAAGGFSGYCSKCEKPGHCQADCPGPKAGAGAGGGTAASAVEAAKTGKGHKQKGAGTVVISKGPVETRSGVMIKDWQRLPTQLLLEWTQREKRPKPMYFQVKARKGGKTGLKDEDDEEEISDAESWKKYLPENQASSGAQVERTDWRQRVHLNDPQRDDRSLSFCPAQVSPTEPLARELAALLALLVVCGDLPLERKPPNEFRDVWLASQATSVAGKGGGWGKAQPVVVMAAAAAAAKPVAKKPPAAAAAAALQGRFVLREGVRSSTGRREVTRRLAKRKGCVF